MAPNNNQCCADQMSFMLICHSSLMNTISDWNNVFPWCIIQLPFTSKVNMTTTRRLEYLPGYSVSRSAVYSSASSSHPLKPTTACSEIGFVLPGLLKPVNPSAFKGLTYSPAMGEVELKYFSAIKHLTKEELCRIREYSSFSWEQNKGIWCVVTNTPLISPIPLPAYILTAIFTLMNHSSFFHLFSI